MRILLVLIALIYAANCSIAQTASMDYFVGNWNFKGWLAGNNSDKANYNADWEVTKELDSAFCLTGHVTLSDGRVFTREMIGYNPQSKSYVRTILANEGSYFVFSSIGWQKEQLIWEGTQSQAGKSTKLKEVVTRQSTDSFTAIFYKWQKNKWNYTQKEMLHRIK